MLKILFCGDVVGRSGRSVIKKYIPLLKEQFDIDFIIVNGENTAHGLGITPTICEELFSLPIDAITSGNHIWKHKEIIPYIEKNPRLLRPINYPEGTPGVGFHIFQTPFNKKIMVMNVLCRVFMNPVDDPFMAVEKILLRHELKKDIDAIFIDLHGEASSEKMAFAHYFDGRVSAVVGTHSHIPTADTRILAQGTGYQTDAGMCGDYQSVIGMEIQSALGKFLTRIPSTPYKPAEGPGTLCGVLIDINDQGLTQHIQPIRLGAHLIQTPEIKDI